MVTSLEILAVVLLIAWFVSTVLIWAVDLKDRMTLWETFKSQRLFLIECSKRLY